MLCEIGEDSLAIEAALFGLSDIRLAAEGEVAIGTGRGDAIWELGIGNQRYPKVAEMARKMPAIKMSPGDKVSVWQVQIG